MGICIQSVSLHHSLSAPSCMFVSIIWIMDMRMGTYKVTKLVPVDYACIHIEVITHMCISESR